MALEGLICSGKVAYDTATRSVYRLRYTELVGMCQEARLLV